MMIKYKVNLHFMVSDGTVYTSIPISKKIFLPFVPVVNMRIEIDGISHLVEAVVYIVKTDMFDVKIKNDRRLGLHLNNKTVDDLANDYVKKGWERIR